VVRGQQDRRRVWVLNSGLAKGLGAGLWQGSARWTWDKMAGAKHAAAIRAVVVVNAVNCAPCHLPGIDGTVDRGLRPASSTLACSICRELTRDGEMILCDGCDQGSHLDCLEPPLSVVPKGRWYCPGCRGERARDPSMVPEQIRVTGRERDDRGMDGARVQIRPGAKVGTAHYLGPEHEPGAFDVRYEDGSAERLTARQVRRRRVVDG